MGRRRLAWELSQTGLGRALVEAVVEETWEGKSEREVALALARRRLASPKGVPEAKAKARLKGYLERRGFSSDDIFSVLDELFTR